MKINSFLYAVLLGLIIPWLLLFTAKKPTQEKNTEPTRAQIANNSSQQLISVVFAENDVRQMELESYILGVLVGEMPADFELEALKAQAVVARTFAVKTQRAGTKHDNGAICVDSACCQNYYAPDAYLQDGGTPENLEKFQTAVNLTKGQILTYQGQLIEATYFSCSGGKTEDAEAVWGTAVPYLQAIASPGEEHATHYMDTVSFTTEEFEKRLGQDLPGIPETWVGKISYTAGGGVATIDLGGRSYTGTQLRQKLGLNSTVFVVTAVGNGVTVTTKGFGHRVGMSQYGADAMAAQGKDYQQILEYYYQGTTMETI